MNETAATISPFPPADPSMNFDLLRQEGLGHLEQLATHIWTDFNLHDPGITILEVLCYAITDIGYRANFPVEDLIAQAPGPGSKPDFFMARDILPGEPVTPADFVKLLIDVPKVRNALLEKAEFDQAGISRSNGVYKVWLDVDNELDLDDTVQTDAIKKAAFNQLMAHRPLCEDFLQPEIMPTVEISIDLKVDLQPEAAPEEVKAEIMFRIQEYFTPSIQQYSLKQLLERGIPCDQIYSGPWLKNGFVLDDEVTRAIPKQKLYRSDLYRIILGIPGVAAVTSFEWGRCNNCEPEFTPQWCLCVCKPADDRTLYKPLLDVKCSKYAFSQNRLLVAVDEQETNLMLEWLRFKAENIADLSQPYPDFPRGTHHNWQAYTSVQYDLPRVYAQAENELPENASPLRKAQAKQLRAYLLFFDQLLAGYLARLSEVRNLLSISQDTDGPTSFAQALRDVPGVLELLNCPDTYEADLLAIVESTVHRKEGKDKLLSHLLARFGEQFTDYSVALYGVLQGTGNMIREPYAEYLSDKTEFLRELPIMTAERSKGFNYRAKDKYGRPDVWNIVATNTLEKHQCLNVEGVKKRVSRLLGWDSYSRRTLTTKHNFKITISSRAEGESGTYYFQVFDHDKLLLSNVSDFKTKEKAMVKIEDFYNVCQDPGSFKVIEVNSKYRLMAGDIAQSVLLSESGADSLKEQILKLLKPASQQADGFHVLEHILLRPNDIND